ncbi:MAG: hypothetical protein IKB47_04225 [Clostridia bacterium]|nr:hypothetical protein [Clostridia bacterium]
MNDLEKSFAPIKPNKSFKKNHTLDIVALILCLIAAFLIWLFVANSSRAVVEKTIIVTVDAKSQIEDDTGLSIINGLDMTDYSQFKVTLKVSGMQSTLDKYSDDDYIIRVQTDPIKEGGAGKYTLRFSDPVLPDQSLTLNSMEPAYFDAFVDKLITKQVDVTASVSEGGISDGTLDIYPIASANDKSVVLEKVTISGPKSTIDAIDMVDVKVSVANYSKSTIVKSRTFEFFDAYGVEYKNDNNYITVKPSEVDVNLVINYSSKAVSIYSKFNAADSDEYKYHVELSFAGSTDVVIRLSGDSLEFPPDDRLAYDFGDITDKAGTTFTVNVADIVADYEEKGLTVNADDKAKVLTVTVTKEKIVTNEATS